MCTPLDLKVGATSPDAVLTTPSTAPPMVTAPTQMMTVTEGDFVTLTCYASGEPPPLWSWAVDLTYTIPHSSNDQYTGYVQGIYNIPNVKLEHQHRYWCVGTSVLVNPPLGKRSVVDMTYIDLIVKREFC